MTPKRIQMSRQHPWRAENPDAVIVDRTTKWGNPFAVGALTTMELHPAHVSMPILSATVTPRNVEEAVRLFRYAIDGEKFHRPHVPGVEEIRAELEGKDLVCWCRPGHPCHADVLLELANGGTP